MAKSWWPCLQPGFSCMAPVKKRERTYEPALLEQSRNTHRVTKNWLKLASPICNRGARIGRLRQRQPLLIPSNERSSESTPGLWRAFRWRVFRLGCRVFLKHCIECGKGYPVEEVDPTSNTAIVEIIWSTQPRDSLASLLEDVSHQGDLL